MEGVKANRYAALQGGEGGIKILSKSALTVERSLSIFILFTYPYYCYKHGCAVSRSSPPEVFLGKGVLKICSKFTG